MSIIVANCHSSGVNIGSNNSVIPQATLWPKFVKFINFVVKPLMTPQTRGNNLTKKRRRTEDDRTACVLCLLRRPGERLVSSPSSRRASCVFSVVPESVFASSKGQSQRRDGEEFLCLLRRTAGGGQKVTQYLYKNVQFSANYCE